MNRKEPEHGGKQFIEITLSGSKVRFTFVGDANGTVNLNYHLCEGTVNVEFSHLLLVLVIAI